MIIEQSIEIGKIIKNNEYDDCMPVKKWWKY